MVFWLVGILMLLATPFVLAQDVSVTDYDPAVSRANNLRFSGFHNWGQTGDSVTANILSAGALISHVLFLTSVCMVP